MILYIVKARATHGGYNEEVEVLNKMEEKAKSFIGNNRRINKDNVDQLDEGMFFGSYQIVLTDKGEIQDARRTVKEAVRNYQLNKYEEAVIAISEIDAHDIDSDIEY